MWAIFGAFRRKLQGFHRQILTPRIESAIRTKCRPLAADGDHPRGAGRGAERPSGASSLPANAGNAEHQLTIHIDDAFKNRIGQMGTECTGRSEVTHATASGREASHSPATRKTSSVSSCHGSSAASPGRPCRPRCRDDPPEYGRSEGCGQSTRSPDNDGNGRSGSGSAQDNPPISDHLPAAGFNVDSCICGCPGI